MPYTNEKKKGKVFFIGAGPGDPELITVKGQKLIKKAELVLYAGSLVPTEVVICAKESAEIVDSSSMTLDETHALIMKKVNSGGMVARVHTGDPSLYGAVGEQMALLKREGILYEVVPGVTAAFAAAAAAGTPLTAPGGTQTVIFTRISGNTPVPEKERLKDLAAHGSSILLYLSASDPAGMVYELTKAGLPEKTPVVVGHRVGWPDERIFFSSLSSLEKTIKNAGIKRQAVFLVLPENHEKSVSSLYDPAFSHGFRKAEK